MVRFKIFSILSTLSITTTIFSCISCNDSDKAKQIVGGSVHLFGYSIGMDSYCWKAFIGNNNCSSSVQWGIEPLTFGIHIKYQHLEQGISICWSNLSPGSYYFKLKATNSVWDEQNTFYSPTIDLEIFGETPVRGGSLQLSNMNSSGQDNNSWKIIYNGVDYSKKAQWSIQNLSPATTGVSIRYVDNKNGAIVSWNNLTVNTYKFKVKCTFKPDHSSDELSFLSDNIQLTINRYDYIDITGGSHCILAQCNKEGADNNLLRCYLNSYEDVTLNTTFSIQWDNSQSQNDVYIYTNEKFESYIAWKNTFTKPTTIYFKILAKYKNLESTSLDYYTITFQ